MGNKPGSGKHDDVLMSTAIGLWIAFNAPAYSPSWRNDKPRERDRATITEASF
jgi:hypothetical protein